MQQLTARVIAKQELAEGVFKLTLFAPAAAGKCQPGQFVHLLCGENQSYILRRPFSVHRVIGVDTIEILVKVVGRGTGWLSRRQPQDQIDLLGPLGNPFKITAEMKRAIIVAGGIGVAPLVFLAQKLAEQKVKAFTLMGAATRTHLLDFMDLKRLTRKIAVATDDGSQGHKGMVTDLLAAEIKETEPQMVFGCGPEAMLRQVAGISGRFGIPCQISLEARMACGVGACLGCVVEGAQGYVKVCSDGPVFTSKELGW